MTSTAVKVDLIDDRGAYSTVGPLPSNNFVFNYIVQDIDGMKVINLSPQPAQPDNVQPPFSYEVKPQGGLLAAVGAWEDFGNIDEFIDEIYRMRENAVDRAIDL